MGVPMSGNNEGVTETVPLDKLRLVIITGLSGAGRRTVAHAMEDLGWYVVDNLPPSMLMSLVELVTSQGVDRLAVVLDVRSREMFQQLPVVNARLASAGIIPQVVYLEATDDVIVRRQESTRRPLPLQGDGRLLEGIRKERHMLSTLRASADLVIDTSSLNTHQLVRRIAHSFDTEQSQSLRIAVLSFGFKNGLPIDADMVLDVRFLPNPHWVPDLRPKTGLSEGVSGYVLRQEGAERFLGETLAIIETIAPGYLREGKRQMLLAIGCTGGKHRSVAMTEEISRRLRDLGFSAEALHRDLGKE